MASAAAQAIACELRRNLDVTGCPKWKPRDVERFGSFPASVSLFFASVVEGQWISSVIPESS